MSHDAPSTIHLSHLLRLLLLGVYQNGLIPLEISILPCATIGLCVPAISPGREPQSKLQQQLRHWRPLIECWDMLGMLNRLERALPLQ